MFALGAFIIACGQLLASAPDACALNASSHDSEPLGQASQPPRGRRQARGTVRSGCDSMVLESQAHEARTAWQFYDNCHHDERGSALVAEAMLSFIADAMRSRRGGR